MPQKPLAWVMTFDKDVHALAWAALPVHVRIVAGGHYNYNDTG